VSKFYVTGGKQRKDANKKPEWFSYGEAAVYSFDTETGDVVECVSYRSPDQVRPDDPEASVVFKAGSLDGDRLLVCTQTEILVYSLPDFEQVGYCSHPWLNDVHHVKVNAAGNYLVANTGLDLVLELSPDGEVVREWRALPDEDPWARFDRNVDYRKVVTTKPHHCHPNYVFEVEGELWVSRFVQMDAICLNSPDKRIEIGIEKIHDGVVRDGLVYFSTVNGHIAVADPAACEVKRSYDLFAMTDTNKTLGWCRGVHHLDDERILVGFSRLRPSKIKENLRWARFQIGMREDSGKHPTRVSCYNLSQGELEWEINLEKHGLNAVFSILPADG